MFNSVYSGSLTDYYILRKSVLSESARKHELCYLRRFDTYLEKNICRKLVFRGVHKWMDCFFPERRSCIENEVIVIRQFLKYLSLSGQRVFLPAIPKVREDYVPYIFNDDEIKSIFKSADSIIQKDHKADPYLVIEFPVILRLLYSCGLRIGETIKLGT